MRQITYWIIERDNDEFLVYVDDRYQYLYYASPELFTTYQEALEVSTGAKWNNQPMGGTVKQVQLIISDTPVTVS